MPQPAQRRAVDKVLEIFNATGLIQDGLVHDDKGGRRYSDRTVAVVPQSRRRGKVSVPDVGPRNSASVSAATYGCVNRMAIEVEPGPAARDDVATMLAPKKDPYAPTY